jgi:hypothetical protein
MSGNPPPVISVSNIQKKKNVFDRLFPSRETLGQALRLPAWEEYTL